MGLRSDDDMGHMMGPHETMALLRRAETAEARVAKLERENAKLLWSVNWNARTGETTAVDAINTIEHWRTSEAAEAKSAAVHARHVATGKESSWCNLCSAADGEDGCPRHPLTGNEVP